MATKPATHTNQGTPSACPATTLLHGIPAVAKALGIGETYTWALIKDGKIKSVLLGRRRLVRDQDLQAFAASLISAKTGA
jgi:excisionase family DNA binding protein